MGASQDTSRRFRLVVLEVVPFKVFCPGVLSTWDPLSALISFESDRPKCLRTALRLTDSAAAIRLSDQPAAANALLANPQVTNALSITSRFA